MQCPVCTQNAFLPTHIGNHGLSESDFRAQYPDHPLVSAEEALNFYGAIPVPYTRPAKVDGLRVRVGLYDLPFHADVPKDACLPSPPNYRVPQHGALAAAIQDAILAFRSGKSMFIHGPPGSGKDGLVHYLSAVTRRPGMIFQIQPGAQIRNWFFVQQFNTEGVYYQEGSLLKALRDGYTTPSGKVIPYLILLTDFDRADRSQAEYLRLVMDSIEGRVMGPTGQVYHVLPGTTVVATANSAGAGDESGRLVSTNPIDSSILDRFQRMFLFPWLEWEDEREIALEKYPWVKGHEGLLTTLGQVTYKVRESINNGSLPAEYTHRGLCNTLEAWRDMLDVGYLPQEGLLRALTCTLVHRMPNSIARQDVERIFAPYFK